MWVAWSRLFQHIPEFSIKRDLVTVPVILAMFAYLAAGIEPHQIDELR